MLPPNLKLVAALASLAKDHGYKLLHVNNIDMLTHDLGNALTRQKKVITDPTMGIIETAYDALPLMAEVKLLTFAVSKKLGIESADSDGKSKDMINILEEIVQLTEARNSKAASSIKNTLEWTRDFYNQFEIQEINKVDLVQIEPPKSWLNLGELSKSFSQTTTRVTTEFTRLQDFLKRVKTPPAAPPAPNKDVPKL